MIKFETTQNQIQAQTPSYIWRWEAETDTLSILDAQNRLISKSKHQPQILPSDFQSATPTYEIKDNTICITYHSTKNASYLVVTWFFHSTFISLQPFDYHSPNQKDVSQIIYFPNLYSHYAVMPGLSMATNISPIVDLHSNLSVTTVLGSGAMRGPVMLIMPPSA